MSSRYFSTDVYADQFSGGMLAMAAFLLVVGIWLLVQAFNLVLRVLVRYRHERILWIMLGATTLAWIMAALAAGLRANANIVDGCAVLAAISTGVFLLVCRIVELLHDEQFQEESRPGLMLEKVLARPWWQTLRA